MTALAPQAGAGLLAGVLLALAVSLWPRRVRTRDASRLLDPPRRPGRGSGRTGTDGHEHGLAVAGARARASRGGWLGRRLGWLGRRDRDEAAAELALLDALVPALRGGLAPVVALRAIVAEAGAPGARGLPAALLESAEAGRPLGPVWTEHATSARSPELALVAQAWTLSDRAGAPLAECAELAAELARHRVAWQRRVDLAVAGPRATMTILTALPLGGPALALVFGVTPAQLYAGSPAGSVSAGVGLVLLGLGRWWCRRMVQALSRPRPLG